MRDDLISRSMAIKEFYKCVGRDLTINEAVCVDNIIERIPSAYDVDKVMGLLKGKAEHAESKAAEYDEKGNISMMDIWGAVAKTYRDAIEIVKSDEFG